MTVSEMLAEFHAAFGQSFGDGGSGSNGLRKRLHEEEYQELVEALDSADRVAIAHELADMVYVAYGTAHSLGLDINGMVDHPQVFHDRPLFLVHERLVSALDESDREHNREHICLSLTELVATCYALAYRCPIDLDAVIAEVHRANMSKADPDGRMVLDEHGKAIKPDHFRPPDVAGVLAGVGDPNDGARGS